MRHSTEVFGCDAVAVCCSSSVLTKIPSMPEYKHTAENREKGTKWSLVSHFHGFQAKPRQSSFLALFIFWFMISQSR